MIMGTLDGKRLVYLSDASIPSREANSIQTMKMCEAFAKSGLEVRLIVPNRPAIDDVDPFEFYEVDPCFEIRRTPWRPGERYLYSLLAPFYVRRFKPDIVYGRFVPACFFSSLFGYRVVIESHSPVSDAQLPIEYMFKILAKTNRIIKLIVISETLQDYYLSEFSEFGQEDIIVAHDAASSHSEVEPFPIVDTDRLQVGYVGHLYEGKGMELIADLVEECAWADFHIVGGTEEDIECWENKLQELENVEFHGFVAPSKVVRYLRSMDVLLAPYQEEVFGAGRTIDISRWMSPLKIFEYMSVGGVIISSDLPVLREVLADGENAILCDPSDIECWRDSLRLLNQDADLRKHLSKNARSEFQDKHTFSARADRILSQLG